MEKIDKVLRQLESKLARQRESVEITEAHINHLRETNLGYRLDVDADGKKEATPKKK